VSEMWSMVEGVGVSVFTWRRHLFEWEKDTLGDCDLIGGLYVDK